MHGVATSIFFILALYRAHINKNLIPNKQNKRISISFQSKAKKSFIPATDYGKVMKKIFPNTSYRRIHNAKELSYNKT